MCRATLAAAAQCNFSKLVSVIRKVFVNLIPHNYAKNEEENNVRLCSYNVSMRKARTRGSDANPESVDYDKTNNFTWPTPAGYHDNHAWKSYWRVGNSTY